MNTAVVTFTNLGTYLQTQVYGARKCTHLASLKKNAAPYSVSLIEENELQLAKLTAIQNLGTILIVQLAAYLSHALVDDEASFSRQIAAISTAYAAYQLFFQRPADRDLSVSQLYHLREMKETCETIEQLIGPRLGSHQPRGNIEKYFRDKVTRCASRKHHNQFLSKLVQAYSDYEPEFSAVLEASVKNHPSARGNEERAAGLREAKNRTDSSQPISKKALIKRIVNAGLRQTILNSTPQSTNLTLYQNSVKKVQRSQRCYNSIAIIVGLASGIFSPFIARQFAKLAPSDGSFLYLGYMLPIIAFGGLKELYDGEPVSANKTYDKQHVLQIIDRVKQKLLYVDYDAAKSHLAKLGSIVGDSKFTLE